MVQSPSPPQATPFQVLVVDDDPSIRRMIIASLRRDGYAFREAENGQEALDAMHSSPPDAVVLDLMMPLVSGWDVLKEREKDENLKKIPVIVVSANRGPEISDAVNRGICAFLPKPFDIGALNAIVKNCLYPPAPSETPC